MGNYIKRLLEDDIIENSKSFPVILICGPRQVGKTTILEKISECKINYVSLDNPLERKSAKEDPSLFLENHSLPLIIDEIQYATELLPYIKMKVDKLRLESLSNNTNCTGLYYLTSSQMFTMMQNVSESLAGYSDSKTLEKSAINGNMFETYVVMEIVKSFVNDNKDPRLYINFYRDSNQIEIDLIITINNTVYPIEIKKSKNPNRSMIKNFKILNKGEKDIGEGGVICMVENIIPLDENNIAIPIQCI